MQKKNNLNVLVVIDMQKDFVDGVLGTKEARAIVDNVNKKISDYRASGDVVIFTRDTHDENYLNTAEGRKLPVPHCIKGTEGWQITSKIEVLDDIVIDKPTFGSFELADWISYFSIYDIVSIEIVGVCTDICVISNAMILKAKFPEMSIFVDSSCCAGVTPESHNNALEAMKMCQIEVI